jgi:hypothetical protein
VLEVELVPEVELELEVEMVEAPIQVTGCLKQEMKCEGQARRYLIITRRIHFT